MAASLCTAKLSSPSCKLAGDSPYWLVASAPHGAASWYMDMGVHHQTSALRPAGSKEQWLVRKIGNIPAFTIYGSPVGEPAPPRPASDQTGLIGDPHKVVEGVGWGAFRLGATRSELVTAYGAPSQNFDPREPSLHWRKQHIYCLIDSVRGASRLRFGKGFEIPLASGVRIGSPESQVLSAYGTTTQVLEKGPEKTLEYPSRGVEFLLTHGVVSEFTVFRPRGAVAVAHSPTSPRMKEWAKANSRMARDASLFSQKELTEVYWLALVADKRPGSEEARKAAKTLVQKYPKSSRAGGALVCLGEMSHGEEKIAYLKQAIADYSDCFFSDGVQVGAYARFLLGRAYLDSGDSEKAKALFEEIRKNYPDAIDHSGASLVIRAMPANPAAGGAALPVTVAPAEILGTTPTIGANPQLSFRCEGGVSVAATLKLFRLHGVLVRRWEIQTPKTMTLDLTGLEPDNYYLYVYAEGYLKRLTGINVSRDGVGVSSPDFMLYRKRYVVLRYASNHSGSRDLSPGKVGQRRVAVADLGEVPELRGDWRVRQQGEEVSLEFYRMQSYFGFAPAPAGATFDQLRLAPENDQYRCTNVRATPGLLLFTRIHGNNQSDACFAKIEVEQVTETPPPNVEVIARPR